LLALEKITLNTATPLFGLKLRGVRVNEESLARLAATVLDQSIDLQSLQLANLRIRNISPFTKALPELTCLKVLNLSGTLLTVS
jgi:hypothetical protein